MFSMMESVWNGMPIASLIPVPMSGVRREKVMPISNGMGIPSTNGMTNSIANL